MLDLRNTRAHMVRGVWLFASEDYYALYLKKDYYAPSEVFGTIPFQEFFCVSSVTWYCIRLSVGHKRQRGTFGYKFLSWT